MDDLIKSFIQQFKDFGAIASWSTQKNVWIRFGIAWAGIVMTALGIFLLFRKPLGNALNQAVEVAKPI